MFILAAKFNDTYNFEMYPDIGTDHGICKTIRPMVSVIAIISLVILLFLCAQVDFRKDLPTPKHKDEFVIPKGESVVSGENNGLVLHLDAEALDHGYSPSVGKSIEK